jgi:CRISPR/Cas system-associated exonuclease Cas4 (RecB family)
MPHYDIEQLEIIYMDMSDVLRVPVEVMPVRRVVSWLVPRVKKLRSALDGGPMPPRVGPEGLWQCQGYCSFASFCWPRGVPTPSELRKKEKARKDAILKALGRR